MHILNQEASLQIIIKCDLNTASDEVVKSTSWLMYEEYNAGVLLYITCLTVLFSTDWKGRYLAL